MGTETLAAAVERVREWARSGEDILSRIIPSLLQEADALRERLRAAEDVATQLRGEVDNLRGETAKLYEELDRLNRQRAEAKDLVERHLAEIGQRASEVLFKLGQP